MGCDYNPEQWPPSVWREDVALMREAGVGFVTLGVFSWALLEPEPDRYDFGWFDEVLELLHEGGIAVDMATATAAPPPWLTNAHPEMLPVDAEGRTLWPGSRQSWCPSSPVFREHAVALVEQMARRYGTPPRRPALARQQRAGLPHRQVLVRRQRRGVPALARRPLRVDRRAERRLGHRVLVAALPELRGGAAAADHPGRAQPHPRAGLRALLLRRAARLLPGRARRAAARCRRTSR